LLEEILQKADEKICQASGSDFSSYDTACILNEDDSQITTQQQWVERSAVYMCGLETAHNTFITEVYNTFVTEITEIINNNALAGITSCDVVGIFPTDEIGAALTKISDKVCEFFDFIDLVGIDWNVYGFTVGTTPTDMVSIINTLLSYIGETKNLIPTGGTVALPTFNNVGSCLPGTLTTTDTLVSTVGKIKTKLCELDYSLTGLTFGCVTASSTLSGVLQNVITRLNQHSIYTFDPAYFLYRFKCTSNSVIKLYNK
jgi:hypothetical protein